MRYRGSRPLLRADAVRSHPRWAKATWDRCPFALVQHPACPEPDAGLESIGRVWQLAGWAKDGAPLRDIEPSPTEAVFPAVQLASAELFDRWKHDKDSD